jgi:toxin ParE1/3/4
MPSVLQTPDAQFDLMEIWSYISADNPAAADQWWDDVEATSLMLAANPTAGRHRNEFLPRLRSFPVGNYIIFYEPIEGGIRVLRVLHGARDLRELL